MTQPNFTMTNESITVVLNGKTCTVQKGSPNFLNLRQAIMAERWDEVPKHLSIQGSLEAWANGKFTLKDGKFHFNGGPIPDSLHRRIASMAGGGEDPEPLFKFWERLQRNPSMRSIEQTWPFMEHMSIPITKDGCLLAYKGVNSDLTDKYTGKVSNEVGTVNEMPRNKISDDPNQGCHYGFHVGALAYAKSFANRVIICKVDPADIVCVPYENSYQKMRVCKYKVVGHWNGQPMPNTTIDPGDYGEEPLRETIRVGADECLVVEFVPVQDTTKQLIADAAEAVEKIPADELEAAAKGPERKPTKGFAKFDKLDFGGLMMQSLDDLRQYAGKGLKIVGASKIAGGKASLAARILEVRK
jgi:hypothetical protein